MPTFNRVGPISAIRKATGDFLELSKLVSILPEDYLIHIKRGADIMWEGIAWVFTYDGMERRYKDYAVLGFEINHNNTEAMISVAWQYR